MTEEQIKSALKVLTEDHPVWRALMALLKHARERALIVLTNPAATDDELRYYSGVLGHVDELTEQLNTLKT